MTQDAFDFEPLGNDYRNDPDPEEFEKGREMAALLFEKTQREFRGHPRYYQPFDTEDSKLLREYYKKTCPIIEHTSIKNTNDTMIAVDYRRIVYGDYGAYVEIEPNDMTLSNLEYRFGNRPTRPVKYLWMQTVDSLKTKVYHQQGTVRYADYIVGMYYVSPFDIKQD